MCLEDRIFKTLAKKRLHGLARMLAKLSLIARNRVTAQQFDQYLTLLGAETLKTKLKYPTTAQLTKLDQFDQHQTVEPNQKLKIAVMLSGQPRSVEHCIESILRFFHGHDVQFFCQSWTGNAREDLLAKLGSYQLTEIQAPEFYEFERKAIEQCGLKEFKDGIRVPYLSPNLFPMWYGVKAAYNLLSTSASSQDFDLFCRMRYDSFWLGQLNLDDIQLDDSHIYVEKNYSGYGGYGDQFAIGTPAAMLDYFNLYDWLTTEFLDKPRSEACFPEVILKKYLEDILGKSVFEINLGLRLLRDEYVGLAPTQIPLRNHDVSKNRNAAISKKIKKKFPDLYQNAVR